MELSIGVIVIIIMGFVAVTTIVVAIRVDFVELLKFRRKTRLQRVQLTCPHTNMWIDDDDNLCVESLFVSPPGTVRWSCTRCNLTVLSESAVRQNQAYWMSNWTEWSKQMERLNKLISKL